MAGPVLTTIRTWIEGSREKSSNGSDKYASGESMLFCVNLNITYEQFM